MSKLIPPRPPYKPEKHTVGVAVLAVFLLAFAARLLFLFLPVLGDMPYFVLAEVLAIIVPFVTFAILRGKGYGKALRIKMPRVTHTPFLIAAFFVLLFGGFLLVLLVGDTEAVDSVLTPLAISADAGLLDKILAPLLFAILPAVIEGFFFRGVAALEYERRGAVRAVLMSALLYAAVHFDLSNFLVHLFVGVLLMLVLYATDSLLATVILHALFNLALYFGGTYLKVLFDFTGNLRLMLFLLILGFLLSLFAMLMIVAAIYRARDEYGIGDPRRAVPYEVQYHTILDALRDPSIIVCLILTVLGFIFL